MLQFCARPCKTLREHAVVHAVVRVSKLVRSKIPAQLPRNFDRIYVYARSSVGSAAAATASMASKVRAQAVKHASTATALARHRVLPAVKPYTDAASKHLEPHVRPVTRLAQKHVRPAWAGLERDFEKATRGTPKLQVRSEHAPPPFPGCPCCDWNGDSATPCWSYPLRPGAQKECASGLPSCVQVAQHQQATLECQVRKRKGHSLYGQH
jgi:hypothetical protein